MKVFKYLYCTSLTSLTIGSSVTTIGSGAFQSCTSLANLVVNSNAATSGVFGGFTSITSLTMGNSVTTIGSYAFSNCSSLTSCTLGSGVTSIGSNAFYYCKSLTSITSNAATAPTIQSGTFQIVGTGGTLTVPIGSSGYDVWMGTGNYYLGKYNWTKVEQ